MPMYKTYHIAQCSLGQWFSDIQWEGILVIVNTLNQHNRDLSGTVTPAVPPAPDDALGQHKEASDELRLKSTGASASCLESPQKHILRSSYTTNAHFIPKRIPSRNLPLKELQNDFRP